MAEDPEISNRYLNFSHISGYMGKARALEILNRRRKKYRVPDYDEMFNLRDGQEIEDDGKKAKVTFFTKRTELDQ